MNFRLIQQFKLVCSVLLLHHANTVVVSAYCIGDAVDTDLVMDGFMWDALRSQMPKFGINTKVHFDMDLADSADEDPRYRTFALLFEDGLRSVETRPYEKTAWRGQTQTLERVLVKFVYSKSGTGMIHSVSSTAVYKAENAASSSNNSRRFRVEYEWQEEEAVRLTVGSVVMFLAVFLSSIVFLFQTCGLNDGDPIDALEEDYHHHHRTNSDHKKW